MNQIQQFQDYLNDQRYEQIQSFYEDLNSVDYDRETISNVTKQECFKSYESFDDYVEYISSFTEIAVSVYDQFIDSDSVDFSPSELVTVSLLIDLDPFVRSYMGMGNAPGSHYLIFEIQRRGLELSVQEYNSISNLPSDLQRFIYSAAQMAQTIHSFSDPILSVAETTSENISDESEEQDLGMDLEEEMNKEIVENSSEESEDDEEYEINGSTVPHKEKNDSSSEQMESSEVEVEEEEDEFDLLDDFEVEQEVTVDTDEEPSDSFESNGIVDGEPDSDDSDLEDMFDETSSEDEVEDSDSEPESEETEEEQKRRDEAAASFEELFGEIG